MERLGGITFVIDKDKDIYYRRYSQDETKKEIVLETFEITEDQKEHLEKNFSSVYELWDLIDKGYRITIK